MKKQKEAEPLPDDPRDHFTELFKRWLDPDNHGSVAWEDVLAARRRAAQAPERQGNKETGSG